METKNITAGYPMNPEPSVTLTLTCELTMLGKTPSTDGASFPFPCCREKEANEGPREANGPFAAAEAPAPQ